MAPFWIRAIVATSAAWLALGATAPAQDYPARTIRVIIPLGPGGGGDVFTRALADELQKAWGQPVVVENRPGGGLNIGARACAESAPDGYTICVLSSEPVIYNQFLFKSLPFDPEKDFEPITNLFVNTLALVVNNSLKVRTIPELVALSKAKPGTLSYGTFAFPLAHFMEKLRSPLFPDIPTLVEAHGGAEYPSTWFGLFAAAGTPKPIVAKLAGEVGRILDDRDFRRRMFTERAVEPSTLRLADFARFIRDERKVAARIVKESGQPPQ